MANTHETLVSLFIDIADAIRDKLGISDSIVADEFPDKIASITAKEDLNAELREMDELISYIGDALQAHLGDESGWVSGYDPSYSNKTTLGMFNNSLRVILGLVQSLQQAPEVELITFYVDGTEYQAESGWTWSDWVYSEYNTAGFYIDDAEGWIYEPMSGVAIFDGNTWEYPLAAQAIPAGGWYASTEY